MRKARPILLAAILLIFTVYITYASNNTAGTVDDPLVTVSYLEVQYKKTVEKMLADAILNINSGNSSYDISEIIEKMVAEEVGKYISFKPVFIEAGKTVTLGEGTEIIFRSGSAGIVSPHPDIGLTNVTIGRDSLGGETIIADNLYICPRDDGRGFVTLKDSWFMIKGKYTEK